MHTILPAVYFDIIFPPDLTVVINGKDVHLDKPFVSPVLQQSKKVSFPKNSSIFGIRVKPEYSTRLFDAPANELFQGPNDFREVVSKKFQSSIENIVLGTVDFDEKCRKVNQLLFSVKPLKGANSVHDALELIKARPWLQVKELAGETGFSPRWLEILFRDYLGASPSEIIRIIRLNRFLEVMQSNPGEKLTALALEAGYYDQSHLIRDFKYFSSASPGWYKKNYPLISKVMNHL